MFASHPLAVLNNVTININVQAFVWPYIFIPLGHLPRSGIAGSYVDSAFNHLGNCQTV